MVPSLFELTAKSIEVWKLEFLSEDLRNDVFKMRRDVRKESICKQSKLSAINKTSII